MSSQPVQRPEQETVGTASEHAAVLTLNRGLAIVDYLSDHGPRTVNEVAEALALGNRTARRLIDTLAGWQLVAPASDRSRDRLWALGPKAGEWGRRYSGDTPPPAETPRQDLRRLADLVGIVDVARPEMRRLADAVALTVTLSGASGRRCTALDWVEPIGPVQGGGATPYPRSQDEPPLDSCAGGRAILLGRQPEPDEDADLERCRNRGWATTSEGGVTWIAVPIYRAPGEAAWYSLGVVGAEEDLRPRSSEVVSALLDAAERIKPHARTAF
jgi:DNA-binding IclR family transcriptional regulator